MNSTILLAGLACFGGLCLVIKRQITGTRFPPGPKGIPIVGNLLSVPLKHPWIVFREMKAVHGELLYFHGFGNSILVLNSHKAMLDLLVRKGNLYCSRPYFIVACELMELVNSTAFAPFGNRWKLHRKLARVALSPEALREYESTLLNIAKRLNRSLAESPEEFIDHARLAAGRVIMGTMYGISVDSAQDPYISRAEAAMNMISKAVIPGAFFVDLIPALKHIPRWFPFGTRFRTVGENGRSLVAELVAKPFQYVKDEIAAGTTIPSFTRDVLTKNELQLERETDETFEHAVKWAAASMYAAGQEVVSSSILNMIMALALNPQILHKAQLEIDLAVGRQRTPTIDDQDSLPYIHAIVKETLRWHPPLPMDIARASIDDDVYLGYFIPKGTIVIPNIWSLSRAADPDYPPEEFHPERFLENRTHKPLPPSEYCFGFGRRICPGRGLAENAIFLMTASIIAAFDIGFAIDDKGKKIPINVDYSSGLVSLPENFKCSIKPRAPPMEF